MSTTRMGRGHDKEEPRRHQLHGIITRETLVGSGDSSASEFVAVKRRAAAAAAAAPVQRRVAALLLVLVLSLLQAAALQGADMMLSPGSWLWGGGRGSGLRMLSTTMGGVFVSAFVTVPSPPTSLTTRRIATRVFQAHQQRYFVGTTATAAPSSWKLSQQNHRRPSLALFSSSSSSSEGVVAAVSTATPTSESTASESRSSSTAPRVKTVHCTNAIVGQTITVKGWVRTVRKQKTLAFLNVNDGSNVAGLQVVVNMDELLDESSQNDVNALTTGAAVSIVGTVVESPKKESQSVELQATSVTLVGPCPSDTYPLAKKRHSLEYLRSIAHLRPRTNTIAAVARVRSQLAFAIHQFFQTQGFVYVQTPLITASDCEGAGEMFRVTTLDLNQVDKLPRPKDSDGKLSSSVDYKKDFFGKPAYLTVSGQLGGETHACALGDIYTFGPTFRAENSQTTRHLAEFHMVEPELAFCDLDGAMDNAEQLVKSVVKYVLDNSQEDLQFFQKFFDPNLVQRLTALVQEPFVRIPYRDAIAYLQEEIGKDPAQWQFPDVEFGTDLATEHERWLAETKFNTAVFVYNYPKQIKAFYMRDNDGESDSDGRTVAAMDLLVPGVGELIGGSQREDRLDVLESKLAEQGLSADDYWWYLDLRRFGSVPHAGYGLGFERLVTYVTGIDNIREAIAFPRYPGNAEF